MSKKSLAAVTLIMCSLVGYGTATGQSVPDTATPASTSTDTLNAPATATHLDLLPRKHAPDPEAGRHAKEHSSVSRRVARGTCPSCPEPWKASTFCPAGILGREISPIVELDLGDGPALYVGGVTHVGCEQILGIAKWDGSTWSSYGAPLGGFGYINALEVYDDGGGPALYVAGLFTMAGENPANSIAKWNGTEWVALGSGIGDGMFDPVHALLVFDDGQGPALYAGGFFDSAGGVSARNIAKWNGTQWSAVGGGLGSVTTGEVRALAAFDDGTGLSLYAGGSFVTASGVTVNRVARWNGSQWLGLGTGVGNNSLHTVRDLIVFDDGAGESLYAAGAFTFPGPTIVRNIAQWDGAEWNALQTGTDSDIYSLAVFDDGGGEALYAAGGFEDAGGIDAQRIAKWDGAQWSALDAGINAFVSVPTATINNPVHSLVTFNDGDETALFALGNSFSTAGDVSAVRLAKWNGDGWFPIADGMGMHRYIMSFLVFDDGDGAALYAGGEFTSAGTTPANRMAKWNGQQWEPLGAGVNNTVEALTWFDDGSGAALFAAGWFTKAGGSNANRIAKWNGATWSPLGSGVNDRVEAMARFDDGGGVELYVGGRFSSAGGGAASRIAKWDGIAWSALGLGVNDSVLALAEFDDGGGAALYVGGRFTQAGGANASYIAKWDGVAWSAVGAGMNDPVTALFVFDDGSGPALYAGGEFTSAGGESANGMARWDGVGWSGLGEGLGAPVLTVVSTMESFDDGSGPALYVGGSFTTAGENIAGYVAKWDGVNWSALGSGTNDQVLALAAFDDIEGSGLYAGGLFTVAGGQTSAYIAKWPRADVPTVSTGGARYVSITPVPDRPSVAFLVTSDEEPCASGYVGVDGVLGATPFSQSSASWGIAQVRGASLSPSTHYKVQADYGFGLISQPVSVTTADWGDAAHLYGAIDFADVSAVVSRFQGMVFAPPLERCDFVPATPDRMVSFADISATVQAFQGFPYPYGDPCP